MKWPFHNRSSAAQSSPPTPAVRTYTTDAGTASILDHLDDHQVDELEEILTSFDRYLKGFLGGTSSRSIKSEIHFGDHVAKSIRFEIDKKKAEKIISTVTFRNGILWRRGSLRIPNVELPRTLMVSIKGKRIGDVVEGAPFPDFIIRNAIQDKSANGTKLRIRCTGDEQVKIRRK